MSLVPYPLTRRHPVPDWLQGSWDKICESSPIDDILRESLYYPASGIHGLPIELLSGFIYSFVYVDYCINIETVIGRIAQGFTGYKVVGHRTFSYTDFVPAGWAPRFPTPAGWRPRAFWAGDELPSCATPEIDPSKAYALWAVFERDADRGDDWGAPRFSLLYLHKEGAAAYERLFRTRRLAPKVLCMIQPGTGFGGNWTDFYSPTAFFHRVVMEAPGPHPAFIITGGSGPALAESPWPAYGRLVGEETERGRVRMWGPTT